MAGHEADDGARLHRPPTTQGMEFFYEGLEQHQLLIQRCARCGSSREAPAPLCATCGSPEWKAEPCPLTGEIYSYTVHHHPPLPEHPVPHTVAVVELDDGTRVIGSVKPGGEEAEVAIGARVAVEFFTAADSFTFYRFRVTGAR